MKCNEFEILTDDYIDGALSAGQKEEFEQHMRECKSCTKAYEETARVLGMVNSLPEEAVPAHDLWSNIEGRISNKKGRIFKYRKGLSDNGTNADYLYDRKNKFLKYAAVSLIAAMILVALLPSLFMNKNTPILDKVMTPYWKVTKLSGITIVASNIIGAVDSLKPGDWLETKDSSRAVLDVPGLGKVTVEPNTRLQIVKSDSNEHRIALDYGTINADINSKPRTFFVDSRSATAVDLGCSYTYTVYKNGDGILYVKQGMVSLESNGRESLVPEGKFCLAKPGIGPGTPFREKTSAALKDALIKYDFEKGGEKEVETIIRNSRKSDMVTLINLLPRVDNVNKTKLYNHISHYTPPPRHVPKDSIPKMDFKDLNEWIQKFQKEWKDELDKNMKELKENLKNMNKELRENLSKLPDSVYYNGEFNEELQKKIEKNIEKHMDKLNDLDKIIVIPDEIISKSIEESMERANEELEKNNDRIEREMERLQERMERMNEKMQEKMERQKEKQEELRERQEERQEEMEERQREREEELREREQEREEKLKEEDEERREKQEEPEEDYNDLLNNYNFNYSFDNDNDFENVPESQESSVTSGTTVFKEYNSESNSSTTESHSEVKSPETNGEK